jgi:hypothetical protein
MTEEKKHIEQLFTDTSSIDEKKAVEALKPVITIQRDSKEIYFKDDQKLTMEDRVLVYGLAKKLLKMRDFIDNEIISAGEFYRKTGFKKGSIDPAFKSLKGKFLFGKGKNYEIPNYKVNEIIKRLLAKFKIDKDKEK